MERDYGLKIIRPSLLNRLTQCLESELIMPNQRIKKLYGDSVLIPKNSESFENPWVLITDLTQRHSRGSGNPEVLRIVWIPVSAGMTGLCVTSVNKDGYAYFQS